MECISRERGRQNLAFYVISELFMSTGAGWLDGCASRDSIKNRIQGRLCQHKPNPIDWSAGGKSRFYRLPVIQTWSKLGGSRASSCTLAVSAFRKSRMRAFFSNLQDLCIPRLARLQPHFIPSTQAARPGMNN